MERSASFSLGKIFHRQFMNNFRGKLHYCLAVWDWDEGQRTFNEIFIQFYLHLNSLLIASMLSVQSPRKLQEKMKQVKINDENEVSFSRRF